MSAYSRREIMRAGLGGSALTALSGLTAPAPAQRRRRRSPAFNVLFIAVDDLRPALGCYGNREMHTPHIDSLAAEGLTFTRAYCQQAVCNASRASLLTGLRPDTTRVYDLQTHFRRYLPDVRTLPQHFKRNGYVSAALGKIFHEPRMDDLPSWSVPSWIPEHHAWRSEESREFSESNWQKLQREHWISNETFSHNPAKRKSRPQGHSGWGLASWESRKVADSELPDGQIADAAIHALSELRSQRFFLAAGFLTPHLPFVAPEKYYDLYPPGDIELSAYTTPPADAPPFALHNSEELRGYLDIPAEGPIPQAKARELIRGYRACVSYVDAQIGRLLQALTDLGLRDDTVVVLWGDHGYHLGDHGLWSKHTNFEAATHSPLIVSAPGQSSRGKKTTALTEFVDIYPSLCEICDLSRPPGLEGSSFVPLFKDPERLWKRAVFSQYPREIPGVGPGMGHSMRTHRYRYTEWRASDSPYLSAELYDYENDPLETVNLANQPRHVSLVNGLAGMLQEGWRSSLPPTENAI